MQPENFNTDRLAEFAALTESKGWHFRLKEREQEIVDNVWSDWLICPSPSYLETTVDGPLSVRVIEWIDIDAAASPVMNKAADVKAFFTAYGFRCFLTQEGYLRIPVPFEAV